MEKKDSDTKGTEQPIEDAKSTAEGTITTEEMVGKIEEHTKLRNELKETVKKLVNEYATTTNATFQDIRELYTSMAREVEDVFFDHRIQLIIGELDNRYQPKNE